MRRILLDLAAITIGVVVVGLIYIYFWEAIVLFFIGEQPGRMYVESTPISVTIADEEHERIQGLSRRESLGDFEGMLFVFPEEDYYGIWMRDMRFPIDILWIDNEFRIVHLEENVTPDTYPDSFVSDEPARFVLETPAFFAQNTNVVEGDIVRIPPDALPKDLYESVE